MKVISFTAIIEDQAANIARSAGTRILLLRFAAHMNRGLRGEAVLACEVNRIIKNQAAHFHMDLTMVRKVVGFSTKCVPAFAALGAGKYPSRSCFSATGAVNQGR